MSQLSTGSVQAFHSGHPVNFPLYLQLLEVKVLQAKNHTAGKRYRLTVSDGQHSCPLMLATQLAEAIEAHPEQYERGAILQMNEVIANEVNGRRVIIALALTKVGHEPQIIGNPQSVDSGHAQQAPQQGAAAAAPSSAPIQNQNIPPAATGQQPAGVQYGAQPKQDGPGGLQMQQQQPLAPVYNGNQATGGYQYGQQPRAAMPPQYGAPPGHAPVAGGGYGAPPPGAGSGGGQWGGGGYGNRVGPGMPAAPAPQYNMNAGGPVVRNEAPARIMAIRELSPYANRWTIKARVTAKTDLKRFNNAKGEGKLFSFDLLDKDGGEIRATAFNDQADKFFNMVQIGNVYTMSKASLSPKRPQFNPTNHQYEIRLERDTQLEQVPEDADSASIPMVVFNFAPIASLEQMQANTFVDVIGIVEQVNEWQTITRKTGDETRKRSVFLRDTSNRSIELTLWGSYVDQPGAQLEQEYKSGGKPILAVKSARVGDFNGKNLSTVNNTHPVINPDCPEAIQLRNWYQAGGSAQQAKPMSAPGGGGSSKRCSLQAIRDENLGKDAGPKGEYVTVACTIHGLGDVSRGVMYPACQQQVNGRSCNKKMTADMDGSGVYTCPNCGQGQPTWRYMLSMQVADHTRSEWITAFDETGQVLFDGLTADQFRQAEAQDPEFMATMRDKVMYSKLVCRLKVAEDNYNDELRTKLTLAKVDVANPAKESQILLDLIHKLEAGQPVLMAKDPAAAAAGSRPAAAPGVGGGAGYGAPYGGGGGGGGGGPGYVANGGGYNAAAPAQPSSNYTSNPMQMGGGGYGTPVRNPPGGGYQGAPPAAGVGYGAAGGYAGGAGYGAAPQNAYGAPPVAGGYGGGAQPAQQGGASGAGGGFGAPPGPGAYGAPPQAGQGGYGGPGGYAGGGQPGWGGYGGGGYVAQQQQPQQQQQQQPQQQVSMGAPMW